MGYKITWTKDDKHLYTCVGTPEGDFKQGVPNVRSALPAFNFSVYSEKELTQANKDAKVAEMVERILLDLPKPDEKVGWKSHIDSMVGVLKTTANIQGKADEDPELKVLAAKITALKPVVVKEKAING
ncbi:MAG: hypothetical protein Q8K86_00150 [Candidatus Nanopelagicaceae bacterium]|nr:hypothetical protein [Candidatus Nanopelagicaceae bacterium]